MEQIIGLSNMRKIGIVGLVFSLLWGLLAPAMADIGVSESVLTVSQQHSMRGSRKWTPGNNVFGTDGGALGNYVAQTFSSTAYTGVTTLTATSNTVAMVSAASGWAMTLAAASAAPDKLLLVIKTDANSNAITLTRAGANTIVGPDGSVTTYAVNTQYQWVLLISDGTSKWYVVNSSKIDDLTNSSNIALLNTANVFSVTGNSFPATLTTSTISGANGGGAATVGIDTAGGAFGSLYLNGNGLGGNHRLTGTSTGTDRTHTLPATADSNTVIPDTGAANNFLTAISSGGVISKAQPSSSNLSDASNVALRNNANSFSVAQVPSANTVDLGQDGTTWRDIYFRNNSTFTHKITATTPTADRACTYPNADSNPVIPSTGGTNQFANGISSGGVISYGTPGVPSIASFADGRLTLTSATPVTTSDVTSATTLYYVPYTGNRISLYDGSAWQVCTFTGSINLALTTLSVNTVYDVFIYDNNADGVADTMELVAWSSGTARSTALVYQDGILCKTGALGRRYVGTVQTTNGSARGEDSLAFRLVWNYNNRIMRPMSKTSGATTWTYSTNTWRQLNNNSGTVQVSFVTGVAEDAISVDATEFAAGSANASGAYVGIGVDSQTTNSAQQTGRISGNAGTGAWSGHASYKGIPAIGAHTFYPLEAGTGTVTTTFSGSGNDAFTTPGINAYYPM